jgi:hypothetical protein
MSTLAEPGRAFDGQGCDVRFRQALREQRSPLRPEPRTPQMGPGKPTYRTDAPAAFFGRRTMSSNSHAGTVATISKT